MFPHFPGSARSLQQSPSPPLGFRIARKRKSATHIDMMAMSTSFAAPSLEQFHPLVVAASSSSVGANGTQYFSCGIANGASHAPRNSGAWSLASGAGAAGVRVSKISRLGHAHGATGGSSCRSVDAGSLCRSSGGAGESEFPKSVKISRKQQWRVCTASAAVAEGRDRAQRGQDREQEVERAKMQLLQAVLDTKRGAQASADQRATIEEAMVGVEKFDAGTAVALDQLHGTWLLQYTTAPDVISLLQAAELPFLQVGQVYQQFDCRGRTDGGTVENIVRWSIPGLLQENEGATLTVTAGFSVASSRSIVLRFEEARVGEVEISADLEALIAPAILPRTFVNLQILQFLRSLDVRFPLLGPQSKPDDAKRAPIGLRYYLTYLDNNMLLGRALGSGGIFVFSRTQSRRSPM